MEKIGKDLAGNIAFLKRELRCDKNFDVVYRTFTMGGREACMFFVDGFAKDDIIEKIMEFFYSIPADAFPADAHAFSKTSVPYCEVEISGDMPTVITQILSGVWAILVEGYDQAILIDQRTYPQRMTSEPDRDKAFRGSKDGFVETLVFNAALIRRRIRDPGFCIEHMAVGTASKTDVAVCYIEDRVDQKLLDMIKTRIKEAKVDALTMNQESLAELLVKKKWYNPFPKFKFTERPDAASAQVLEGDIVLLVDNSPSALVLPTTLFDVLEEANDYYFPPITGTYLRLTRYLTTLFTTLLTPTWLLLIQNPSWIPPWLAFIKLDEPVHVAPLLQLLILEFAIDGMKLAALNTPSMLTTSFSMIGAIVLGDFAVKSGWFSAEVMLYMAFVAIANYNQPNFELGYALKFMRLILLVATGCFSLWGYLGGLAAILLILVCNRTISGQWYLYPLIPFHWKELKKRVLRMKTDQSAL